MKPSRRTSSFLAALASLVLAAGCETGSEVDHKHPKLSHDVLLVPSRPSVGFAIELGAQLRLTLPVPPPGYAWTIVSNNVRILEQTSALAPTAAEKAAGLPPAPVVTFYSLKPGRSVIRFVILRPVDQDAIPSEHFEVTVLVKENDE